MAENESQKPVDILNDILSGLQSDNAINRLDAIARLKSFTFSSEAIRNELEKLALHDGNEDVRADALAALDLATQRNVRIHFNKVARGNRHILLQEIGDWEKLGFLEKQTADVLRRRYDFDFTPPPTPKPAPVQPVVPTPKPPAPVQPAPIQPAASAPVPMKAAQPAQMTTSQPVRAKVAPAPAPKPAAPPKPKQPPVDWKKVRQRVADAASSGALLRALLYLGAFMIVISATVLVVRFWDVFNPVLQLIFIASVPLIFYVGGWTLRTRLKLIQA
ncbi:MAG: hypothetical protein Q7T89_19405, partial [Anaerolineales bacterium]|nr:hypothetical protein [Anaerolineales bacterium]